MLQFRCVFLLFCFIVSLTLFKNILNSFNKCFLQECKIKDQIIEINSYKVKK